tara:strand:+ start:409 stop:687 length:279 start_codon:yes stop_codon:yes gene_type:complete
LFIAFREINIEKRYFLLASNRVPVYRLSTRAGDIVLEREMTTVMVSIQHRGNSEMVRSENSGFRIFASVAINMVLLISVAAGTFYAIAPMVA